mgnify:CR=1 FL=1
MATKYGTHAEFEHLASVSATSGHPAFYASGSAGSAGDTSTLYLKGPNGNTYDMISGSILQVAGDSGTGTVSMGTGQSLTIAGGTGLDTSMSGQTLTFSMDLNELSAAAVDVGNDSIAIIDANDSNGSKKESIADVMTAVAGAGLAASSGVLSLDISELSDVAVASGDKFLMLDSDGGTEQLESIDDISSFQAGTVTSTALAASSGVLKLDIQNLTAETTVADGDLVVIDDGAGGTLRKMTRANFIESAALDSINIDGGAIDGTVIGANSVAAGSFAAIVGTTATLSSTLTANGDVDLGNATSDTITATGRFDSDLVPSSDSARDLGTSALQWAEAHIDHGYIDALTATGTSTLTTVDINGGAIDGTAIGANSASTGKFTTLTATSDASVSGSLHVVGDLDVAGNINSVTKTTSILEVEDINIICASGSNASAADGGGLLIGGFAKGSSAAAFTWDNDNSVIELSIAGSNEAYMSATQFSPSANDGMALGAGAAAWSDLFLASAGVINFNNGDVTLTHAANKLSVAGGNLAVERLEIDSANDYLDVDTNLKVVAAADIVLDPGGNNVLPGSDSADSLGASGTAWANLFVDAIDLNGQGSISMGGTGRIDLDADDDTSIRASADDVITFEAGGTDRVAIGAGSLYPSSDDGCTLGGPNNNWSDLYVADAGVAYFGDDQDVSLTHYADNGLVLNSTRKLYFEDASNYDQYIGSLGSGVTAVASVTEIDLTAPTLDVNASTAVAITSPSVVIDSSTSDKPVVTIKNSNADANPATLEFTKESASPADDDELGEVVFNGDDDGGSETMFAKIVGVSTDVSNGSEDGALQFKFRAAGAVKTVELGAGAGLTLPNDSTYGVVKAHSMVTYSDETLKTNIQPLESALETVNKLQGVSYDWKSDGSHDLGFIAQDVNKVVPQIVYGTDDGDLGLDYSKLTSILVEAVKEQQAQINDLKSKLDK